MTRRQLLYPILLFAKLFSLSHEDGVVFPLGKAARQVYQCLPMAQRVLSHPSATSSLSCTGPVPTFNDQILIDCIGYAKFSNHLLEQGKSSETGTSDDGTSIGNRHPC
jgi:hypothetical protein